MKVLHAAETIKGGVATVINSLVEYQTHQHNVQVICIIPSDQANNLLTINNLRNIHFKRNGRSFLGMLSFFGVFIRTVFKEKPDVIHLHSSFAGLLGRIAILLSGRRQKTKVIYCPHAFGFLMLTSNFKKNIYIFIEIILSRLTDKIICVSQSEFNAARAVGFKENKLITIHNGVPSKSKSNSFIQKNKKHYKLLFVGRFDYQKGIDILSEAIHLLAEENSENFYEFTLIGEAVNSKHHIEFNNTENIKFNMLGWLKPDQLEEQYLNHDALIIPSRWEGFAMVPLEAMSYGLPIIASDIEAFREIESTSESYIDFFDLNADSLFKCLKKINKTKLERNSQISLKAFESQYTVDIMNKKTFENYIK